MDHLDYQHVELWPTRVGLYRHPVLSSRVQHLYDLSLKQPRGDGLASARERRVRGILDGTDEGIEVRECLRALARHFLGERWGAMVDPHHCENRALVIETGGFISTHKDSREGDLTCVLFLSGGGAEQPFNSVGDPRFVVEDPSRYFDEGRLPYEQRHGFSINPRPGLAVFFPSHTPHNQHPYTGKKTHVQIVANFRVEIPPAVEEELFD